MIIPQPIGTSFEDPRILGLAMVPGRHVKSLYVDVDKDFHSALINVLEEPLSVTATDNESAER